MLASLPVHTRQSLYRCLDVTSEQWIENEPELAWAKYTDFVIYLCDGKVVVRVNGHRCSLFGVPCVSWEDGSARWFTKYGDESIEVIETWDTCEFRIYYVNSAWNHIHVRRHLVRVSETDSKIYQLSELGPVVGERFMDRIKLIIDLYNSHSANQVYGSYSK